jgi:hypothetical protein
MSYFNKLVVTIKQNNKIIREENDNIFKIPFDSEYSILIKNLNNLNAIINVSIDGEDVLNKNSINIAKNSSYELEGFVDHTQRITNRFKFVKDTLNNKKSNVGENGLILVTCYYQEEIVNNVYIQQSYPIFVPYRFPVCDDFYYSYGDNFPFTNTIGYSCSNEITCCSVDNGATVKGTPINKELPKNSSNKFFNIVLQLKGIDSEKPVYSKEKIYCTSCGRRCKTNMKFCPECGNQLICE